MEGWHANTYLTSFIVVEFGRCLMNNASRESMMRVLGTSKRTYNSRFNAYKQHFFGLSLTQKCTNGALHSLPALVVI